MANHGCVEFGVKCPIVNFCKFKFNKATQMRKEKKIQNNEWIITESKSFLELLQLDATRVAQTKKSFLKLDRLTYIWFNYSASIVEAWVGARQENSRQSLERRGVLHRFIVWAFLCILYTCTVKGWPIGFLFLLPS